MTALDHLGTLRGALSDWLYDPRYTTAPYEAQAAHADAIEAALAECAREGLGDVVHGLAGVAEWEDTAACWVWRLPGWVSIDTGFHRCQNYEMRPHRYPNKYLGMGKWELACGGKLLSLDWWPINWPNTLGRWTIKEECNFGLKSPEGLALLDTVRAPKEPQP